MLAVVVVIVPEEEDRMNGEHEARPKETPKEEAVVHIAANPDLELRHKQARARGSSFLGQRSISDCRHVGDIQAL